jgi:hypothetical protein
VHDVPVPRAPQEPIQLDPNSSTNIIINLLY